MFNFICTPHCSPPPILHNTNTGSGGTFGPSRMYSSIFQSAFTTLSPILGEAMNANHTDAAKSKPLGSEARNQTVKSIKIKVIEILEFIMDLRLHLRITNLLILFKQLYVAAPTNRQGGKWGHR